MNLKKNKKRNIILHYLYIKRYFNVYNFFFILKLILKNNFIEKQFKVLAIFLIINFNKLSHISYHKNICLLTGHRRSVFNFFKSNRLSILDNLNKFVLPGINKTI